MNLPSQKQYRGGMLKHPPPSSDYRKSTGDVHRPFMHTRCAANNKRDNCFQNQHESSRALWNTT